MKRFVVLMVLVAFGLSLVPLAYGQEGAMGPERVGAMHPMMHKMHEGKPKTTPEQLAGFDEGTKAAWREIQSVELKHKTNGYMALAAAVAIGIAVMGGALGQGKAASSALEGIARNPEASAKIFTPLIISLALIESLVIYALVIAFLLQGRM